jgi:hypothetical protein
MNARKKSKKSSTKNVSPENQSCKNCGHSDSGTYCSRCGQRFADISKPMKEIIGDLVGIFNLDASIFKTIKPFLFKPGFLTKEFLDGKRKKYLSPVRLYLFLSIVFFFLVRYSTNISTEDNNNIVLSTNNDSTQTEVQTDSAGFEIIIGDTLRLNKKQKTSSKDSIAIARNTKIQNAAYKVAENESLYLSNFFNYLSYAMFVLMPLFALILHLLYIRRKRYYVEHLVFSVNMHSFALLILSINATLQIIFKGADEFFDRIALIIPVYFIIGMMRFYKQGFFKVVLKFIILSVVYILLLIIAMGGILVLSTVGL